MVFGKKQISITIYMLSVLPNKKNLGWKPYTVILTVALVAYWPVCLNIYSLKNDAMVYFLPWRYHVSESIQHGHFPFWNPYIYTGMPLHGDVQSGVWNPVTMFISLFTRYNMSVLQWETVFYIFIAGIGMYKLIKEFYNNSWAAILASIAYMCSGFVTDSGSFVVWVANAAYLPFLFLYFYRTICLPSLSNAVKFSFALFLLFTAGYPSFFFFSFYIILIAGVIRVATGLKRKEKKGVIRLLKHLLVTALLFLLLSSPVWISYLDFSKYYKRGGGTDLSAVQQNPFSISSTISYIIPQAATKSTMVTASDLSSRNAYIGLFILLFFILSFLKKRSAVEKFIISAIFFSFLFSLGDVTPVREWCYRFLPLMNSFRHPANMRVFTTIGIILLSAGFLSQLPDSFEKDSLSMVKKALAVMGVAVLIITIIYFTKSSLKLSLNNLTGKKLLDSLSFAEIAFAEGLMQLLFISVFLFAVTRKVLNKKMLFALIAINSIFFCWLALPFTFISQVKTAAVNKYLASFPSGYPAPSAGAAVKAGIFSDSQVINVLGYANFYNKTISIQDHIITPTLNKSYETFLKNALVRQIMADYKPAYFADTSLAVAPEKLYDNSPDSKKIIYFSDTGSEKKPSTFKSGNTIEYIEFKPNIIKLKVNAAGRGILSIFQQFNHNWKARINGHQIPIYRCNDAFICTDVPAGSYTIEFNYEPKAVITSMKISLITFLIILLYFIFQRLKAVRNYE